MSVPHDELAAFLVSAPPRQLTAAVRRARLPSAPLWIACAVAGTVLFGTWPIVDRVFPDRLLDDLRLDLSTPARAAGTLVSVEETGGSVLARDGDQDRERVILRVRFGFEDADGRTVEGTSHVLGNPPDPGVEVPVEYVLGAPDVARIVDSTCSATPRIGALVLLMPAVALLWFWRVLARRRHMHELLARGSYELAAVSGLREHAAMVGAGRVAATLVTQSEDELEVDFDGARREAAILREHAARGTLVGLLRDPARPQRFLLTDAMAEVPEPEDVDEDEEDDEP